MAAEEYLQDIKINKYDLDTEFENQPSRYIKWSTKYANAVRNRDDLEQKRKVIKAELDTEYRQEFDRLKVKITEPVIDSAIRQDERHKEISDQLIIAEEAVNIMEAVKWGFEQRKESLKWLAQLTLAGYYSEVKQPEAMREEKKEKERAETAELLRQQRRGKRCDT